MQINTLDDVSSFARHLIFDKKVNFHPDTPFEDYITPQKTPLFSQAESVQLEETLLQCRIECEKAGADIYELMGDVLFEALGVQWT